MKQFMIYNLRKYLVNEWSALSRVSSNVETVCGCFLILFDLDLGCDLCGGGLDLSGGCGLEKTAATPQGPTSSGS